MNSVFRKGTFQYFRQRRMSRSWTQKFLETPRNINNIKAGYLGCSCSPNLLFKSSSTDANLHQIHFQKTTALKSKESELGDWTMDLGWRLARGPCIPGLELACCPGRTWTSRGKLEVKYREGRAWVSGARSSVGAMGMVNRS